MHTMVFAHAPIEVDELPAARRSLRIALVTETYPPEVNGVSLTLQRVVEGLRARHHDIQLIRPRQTGDDTGLRQERFHEVLMRGMPIPRYPDLKMGVPSKKALVALWSLHRPDLVHIATEGPLGWSALQAARRLKLPVCSDFRTNFHAYSRHYGIAWLYRPIMAYLRKFHNRTGQSSMVLFTETRVYYVTSVSHLPSVGICGFENPQTAAYNFLRIFTGGIGLGTLYDISILFERVYIV